MNLLSLQPDIIYGPVKSRRLGRSLGLNLLPTAFKLCSMNCCYCQYGWTTELTAKVGEHKGLPSADDVRAALESVLSKGQEFEYLTFSGNGEATLHPEFAKIVDLILELRSSFGASFKLALLSNATTVNRVDLADAFRKIDLPLMKLDAGNTSMFKKVNHGVPPVTFDDIVTGIKAMNKVVIQTMFVKGSVDNSTDQEVDSWIARLKEIKPRWVQIYSLDRGSADDRLQVVGQPRLQQIALKVQKGTGIKVDVY